jgi:hypothetical protein
MSETEIKDKAAVPASPIAQNPSAPVEAPANKSINEAAAVGQPKSSLQSPVTTDIPSEEAPMSEPAGFLSETDEAFLDHVNNDPFTRANDAGIGLIKVLGSDADYVGVAPGREDNPVSPDGLPISTSRATFTPLENVPFSPSIRVKDPKSGKFYYPPDECRSWTDCHLDGSYLIPKEVDKVAAAARRQGKIEALARG